MKKYLILSFALATMVVFTARSQNSKYSPDIEENIKKVENNLAGWIQTGDNDRWNLADRMKLYGINGVSIAVIHNHKIEWARGYGLADVTDIRPVTDQTLFQAASISKSLNAVGVLELVQNKKIDTVSDINKYLTTWKFPYDEKAGNKQINIIELLSHTAGLTVSGFSGYEKGSPIPTLSQILNGEKPANSGPVRSLGEPRSEFRYSGGGTTILQMLVTDVTHLPYEVYMKKNVLDRLGMNSSSFAQPPGPEKEKMLATGYINSTEVPGKFHIYPEQAAAGLWTNPTDLAKYIIETQLAWAGNSSKVLTPEMTKFRLTPVRDDVALGFFVNSRVTGSFKYFNHNGGNEGFSCTAIGCRDNGEGVVIMINSNNGEIIEEIANSVATVYNWKDYYLPEVKKVIEPDQASLDKYTGKYNLGGRIITIVKDGNSLMANAGTKSLWRVYFISDSDFFVRETRGFARFTSEKDNKVKGINTNGQFAGRVE